jgi:CheY-like chemotaxis protein
VVFFLHFTIGLAGPIRHGASFVPIRSITGVLMQFSRREPEGIRMPRILSVAADHETLAACNRMLSPLNHEVHGAASRKAALLALRSGAFDLVVLWEGLPAGYADGLQAELGAVRPDIPVLRASGTDPQELAAEVSGALAEHFRRTLAA